MCRALALLRERNVDFRRIAAIAFDGSTHNAVLLDGNMKPLRRTIMWTDQRSVEECAYLKAHCAERIFATAWQMPTPTWTLPQLMWIRNHEKEVMEKTEHVLFVKDYVRYLVTGVSATDYIEAHCHAPLSLAMVAAHVGISASHLRHLLLQETGCGFSVHLEKCRLEKVKKLIAESDANIKSISSECGFRSTAFFYKTFKRYLGMTPLEYARSLN